MFRKWGQFNALINSASQSAGEQKAPCWCRPSPSTPPPPPQSPALTLRLRARRGGSAHSWNGCQRHAHPADAPPGSHQCNWLQHVLLSSLQKQCLENATNFPNPRFPTQLLIQPFNEDCDASKHNSTDTVKIYPLKKKTNMRIISSEPQIFKRQLPRKWDGHTFNNKRVQGQPPEPWPKSTERPSACAGQAFRWSPER